MFAPFLLGCIQICFSLSSEILFYRVNNKDKGGRVLSNFKFTLYEFFGYLLPGGTLFCALLIIWWTVLHANHAIKLDIKFPVSVVTGAILISYLLGHATQALGNLFFFGYDKQLAMDNQKLIPSQLLSCVQRKIAQIIKCDSPSLAPEWIVRFCDEAVVQGGKEGDRELFIYREGFYKGSSIAVGILAFAIALRAAIPGGSLIMNDHTFSAIRIDFLAGSLLGGTISYLLCRRVRRFAEYRITRILVAFVLLNSETVKPKQKTDEVLSD